MNEAMEAGVFASQSICRYRLFCGGVGKDPFKGVAFYFCLVFTFVLASIAELQDGSFGCLASTCVWEMGDSHVLAFIFGFRRHPGFGRLGTQVASADPSSSSPRPLDVR